MKRARRSSFGLACALALGACNSAPREAASVPSVPVTALPGHGSLGQDNSPKLASRLVPAETYIRTYLSIFGGLAPIPTQTAMRGSSGSALFDTWDDYLSALGLPDYHVDIPRSPQTNTIMLAAFERVGVALCDRAMEHDISGASPPPVAQRLVYAFDIPTGALSQTDFATRFDVMHRTFLGYPAALAPPERVPRYYQLYQDVVTRHSAHGAPHSSFTPQQAGWANVCYGLIRHPEFHLY